MPQISPTLQPCLWYDREAEDAARHYLAIFGNGRILATTRYGDNVQEAHGMPAGTVLTVEFEIAGQRFLALNGGPHFQFTEAVSFQVLCDTQDEVDHFWARLSDGGSQGQCGWLKDRFGLSWQVVPRLLMALLGSDDLAKVERTMQAMRGMTKFDIAALRRAADG